MYYAYNQTGKDFGPFSLEELKAKFECGEYLRDKLVRKEGDDKWQSLYEVVDPPSVAHSDLPSASQSTPEAPLGQAELPALLQSLKAGQEEQIRLLRAIRWAIVGFGIWFIIQFWFLPRLLSSTR
jgi:hypothetical protein